MSAAVHALPAAPGATDAAERMPYDKKKLEKKGKGKESYLKGEWPSLLGLDERKLLKTRLKMPVIGMEAEFNVLVNGKEVVPETYWKHPSEFIAQPMLKRTRKSSQLPTGGAVYFDRGVIEVVTPVIELAPGATARVVRSLWEQLAFVRDQLSRWERDTGHTVRLQAYSTHYNISFELRRREQTPYRNLKRLALLLAYILPIPLMLVAANRRSTGIGVRPRGNRIEVTADFTPDPALMITTATLVVGIVREVMRWPHYRLTLLRELPIPTVAGVIPGRHTTRRGWLTKDFHYPRSPFTCDVNAPIWRTRDGRTLSLRQLARETAYFFRKSIRRYSDPFSFRLLFAIMEGYAPSLLELMDRPLAYEDVGRLCRWGKVISELESFRIERKLVPLRQAMGAGPSIEEYALRRRRERALFLTSRRRASEKPTSKKKKKPASVSLLPAEETILPGETSLLPEPSRPRRARKATSKTPRRRAATLSTLPERPSDYLDRRRAGLSRQAGRERRKPGERRKNSYAVPFPDRRLTRSAYEQVFLKLVSGGRLRIGRETYTPIGMKGWYHAIFRRDSDGRERLLTIDQLLKKMDDWQ